MEIQTGWLRRRPGPANVIRIGAAVGVLGVLLFLFGPVDISLIASDATSTSTFAVVEDTFINNTSPHKNYGGYPTLQADNYPNVKRVLLRFHVENLPDGAAVSSATLRMFVVDASTHAGTVNTVWVPGVRLP